MKSNKIFKIFKKFIILFKGRVFYARLLGVKVGKNCRLYIDEFGSEPFLITIGNNVTITSGVQLITHDGSGSIVQVDGRRFYKFASINIGDNVFIGVNSILMPGVNVQENVVIGAGSVVTNSVNSNQVIGGNPARIICDFKSFSEKITTEWLYEDEINWKTSYVNRIMQAVKHYKERKN